MLSVTDKTDDSHCTVTIFGESKSTGETKKDFASFWGSLVVSHYSVPAEPKLDLQLRPDGWNATMGGSMVTAKGQKVAAIMTVLTGYGKMASVLAIFNDEKYANIVQTLIDQMKFER